MGKPNKIYVQRFECEVHIKKCENDISASEDNSLQEVSEVHSNRTEVNNTEKNNTSSVSFGEAEEKIKERIEYDLIIKNRYIDKAQLDGLISIMAEVKSAKAKGYNINGCFIPKDDVVKRLDTIDRFHLEYAMDVLSETADVKNIRAYSLTLLYNAPNTIDSYYRAKVHRDLGL